VITTVVVCVLAFAASALARWLAPVANTDRVRFDAILVLGYPSDADGNPTPEQLERVTEGVREYSAEAMGIPASAIFLEPQALDTIQNACYATRIMKAHGWRSAEVVSSVYHLPRAGYIFSRMPLEWALHPAQPLEPPSAAYLSAAAAVETVKTLRYFLWTRWTETCAP
jgi:hypothetical protein